VPRIRAIDHLVLRVVDVERMIRFYGDVLGCVVERRVEGLGLVQLRAGESLIDLVAVDGNLGRAGGAAPGKEGRNLDHFCLRVEGFDADALRAELAAKGVAAGEVASRYGADGVGPSLYLEDPEGNTIELKGPPWASADTATREAGADDTDPEAEAARDGRFPGP
jgi:glyoxylase I family protein